jgi:hypothetical protein
MAVMRRPYAALFAAAILSCRIIAPAEQSDCAEASLACARKLLQETEPLGGPLRHVLEELAETESYEGSESDLDYLKRRSTDLKRDPIANREAITLLDRAIASHVDELRSAVSAWKIAKFSPPGENIHPLFVQQKLAFLSSERARFYDGGPFEIARRSLLANSIEEKYFIDQKTNPEMLRREIGIIDEILDRYTLPQYEYLKRPQINLQINSNLFWKASLLFALGEKGPAREIFRRLISSESGFGLETKNLGHVFIYRVFDLPYQITVQSGTSEDGRPKLDVMDEGVLQRYYNPAQLALFACSFLDSAGSEGVESYAQSIKGLTLADYYVVAASADDPSKLAQVDDAIRGALDSDDVRGKYEKFLGIVEGQSSALYKPMTQGARLCGIESSLQDHIYSPFVFKATTQYIESPQRKFPHYLLFGGHLNGAQATIVSDFLNSLMSGPLFDRLKRTEGLEIGASGIRPRIDE